MAFFLKKKKEIVLFLSPYPKKLKKQKKNKQLKAQQIDICRVSPQYLNGGVAGCLSKS